MQVGLAAKDLLAREPDLTLYRQLSCFTLQVFSFLDDHRPRQNLCPRPRHIFVLVLIKIFVLDLVKMFIIVVRKVVEWKQSLTQGVNVYKPGQHLPDAEADQVIQIFRWWLGSFQCKTTLVLNWTSLQVAEIKVRPQMEAGVPVLASRVKDDAAPVFKVGSHRPWAGAYGKCFYFDWYICCRINTSHLIETSIAMWSLTAASWIQTQL